MDSVTLLVSLPWPRIEHYSIQLGVLSGYLKSHGKEVRQRNYAKDIRGYIGREYYEAVALGDLQQYESGALLFPDHSEQIKSLFDKVLQNGFDFTAYLGHVKRYLDDVVQEIVSTPCNLLGFTVSFLQLLPSAYVAREVKRQKNIPIVIGGASLLNQFTPHIMETFPWIDYNIVGEGEQTLLDLVNAIESKTADYSSIEGLTHKVGEKVVINQPRKRLTDLDVLPVPDFTEQFEVKLPENLENGLLPTLTLEASRGCFYGKCSFCNLNCQWDNSYRMKSDSIVVQEIQDLVARHKAFRIMFCDTNVSNRLSLFEKIRDLHLDLDLILEVSGHADGLNKHFYDTIKEAGASQIQVGIEAFSDHLLKLIAKGVNLMKNVEILKWCAQNGIKVFYNILSNIPGELPEDLKTTLQNMEYLKYYEPPSRVCPFVLAHDSPAYENPELFNILGWTIPEEVKSCYPHEVADNLSPLLTPIVGFNPTSAIELQDWSSIAKFVESWREIYIKNGNRPGIYYRDNKSFLTIEINEGSKTEYLILRELTREVYLKCSETAQTIKQISQSLGVDEQNVAYELEDLVENKLTFSDGRRFLSLAIPIAFHK